MNPPKRKYITLALDDLRDLIFYDDDEDEEAGLECDWDDDDDDDEV